MGDRIETGGAAFPGQNFSQNGYPNGFNMGMTLRDWFAGQALAGIIAFPGTLDGQSNKTASVIARVSYEMADAMLAARTGGDNG